MVAHRKAGCRRQTDGAGALLIDAFGSPRGLSQQGVEPSVMALWFGHQSIETTRIYWDADLALNQRILDMVTPLIGKSGRYRPDDTLLAFRSSLRQSRLCRGRLHVRIDDTPRHCATGYRLTREIIEPITARRPLA